MEDENKVREEASFKEVLAVVKDVYTGTEYVKKVYSNRAVISRRLNVFTLTVSIIFTVLYATFLVVSGLMGKLSLDLSTVLYAILGVYAALALLIIILAAVSTRAKAGSIKRIAFALKIFRFVIRIVSIVISIAAISVAVTSENSLQGVGWDVVIIVLSVITLLVQFIPLLFGGVLNFVQWLLSPAKFKRRFSAVAVEWYNIAHSGKRFKNSGKKVDKRQYEAIGHVIDGVINPALGNKYISSIKAANLAELVSGVPESDRAVTEGVLKSIFAYAMECGYITSDPCEALHFSGTVEKRSFKERVSGIRTIFGHRFRDDAATTDDD